MLYLHDLAKKNSTSFILWRADGSGQIVFILTVVTIHMIMVRLTEKICKAFDIKWLKRHGFILNNQNIQQYGNGNHNAFKWKNCNIKTIPVFFMAQWWFSYWVRYSRVVSRNNKQPNQWKEIDLTRYFGDKMQSKALMPWKQHCKL